jgi:short-subunit dehydrogenase involved in D-alanine esterification of teichoic acids
MVANPKKVLNLMAKLGKSVPTTSRSAVTIQTKAYFSRSALRLSNSKTKITVINIVIPMVTLSISNLPQLFSMY